VFLGLLVLGVLVLLPYCGHKIFDGQATIQAVKDSLKPDEDEKTVIKDNKAVTVTRKGTRVEGKLRYVPPEGTVTITKKKSGEVKVSVKNKGLSFSPGFGGASFGGRVAPVVDFKFAYFGRLGLTAGTGLSRREFANPYGAVSFHILRNTSVFLGYSIKKDVVLGLRVSF